MSPSTSLTQIPNQKAGKKKKKRHHPWTTHSKEANIRQEKFWKIAQKGRFAGVSITSGILIINWQISTDSSAQIPLKFISQCHNIIEGSIEALKQALNNLTSSRPCLSPWLIYLPRAKLEGGWRPEGDLSCEGSTYFTCKDVNQRVHVCREKKKKKTLFTFHTSHLLRARSSRNQKMISIKTLTNTLLCGAVCRQQCWQSHKLQERLFSSSIGPSLIIFSLAIRTTLELRSGP